MENFQNDQKQLPTAGTVTKFIKIVRRGKNRTWNVLKKKKNLKKIKMKDN